MHDVTQHGAQRIGVVGAGTMGVGIVYVFAMAGFDVFLVEPNAVGTKRALATLRDAATGAVSRGKMTAAEAEAHLARVATLDSADALPEALDLVKAAPREILVVTAPHHPAYHLVLQGLDGAA